MGNNFLVPHSLLPIPHSQCSSEEKNHATFQEEFR
jgi:hypothetical protein